MEKVTQSDPRQYMRLAALLRERILSGKLRPGSRVPSITVLCRERETSRRTAGKAMQVLEAEGLLVRFPGLGYFVRDDVGLPPDQAAPPESQAPPEGTEAHGGEQPDLAESPDRPGSAEPWDVVAGLAEAVPPVNEEPQREAVPPDEAKQEGGAF
jgi:DNA-binding transcriptional MocR family regulator